MKIIELVNNISLPISNEEADVLGQFEANKIIAKEDIVDINKSYYFYFHLNK